MALYALHRGTGENGQLWLSTYDANNGWQPDTLVQNVGISGSPSAVIWDNALHVFHQGSGNSGQLWFSRHDANGWQADTLVQNVGMSDSPSAVVWNTLHSQGSVSVFIWCLEDSAENNYSIERELQS